jgi:hypothetical protein
MNGRIYDPVLGRFLSADIVVQMPHNVQSYNRHPYVLNNPLSYTVPSGYFFWFAVAALFGAFAYATGGVQFARQVLGIAAAILFGPAGPYAAAMATFFGGSFASAVFAGFASGGISSGNIQGAFRGAASAALFFGAGSLADGLAASAGAEAGAATGAPFDSSDFASASAHGSANSIAASGGIGRAGLHAIAGCIGALGGGKCGAGALSAAFGELAGPMIPGGKVEGLIGRAIVGGIAAELGGGKFANGAMTASFGYLFNLLSHIHYGVTFRAARDAGLDRIDSNTLGVLSAAIDFAPGSQETDRAYMHVMRDYRTSLDQGTEAINAFRDRMWERGDLAGLAALLHSYQDSFSSAHAGIQGYNKEAQRPSFWPGWDHFKRDAGWDGSLTSAMVQDMVGGSRVIIKNYMAVHPSIGRWLGQ